MYTMSPLVLAVLLALCAYTVHGSACGLNSKLVLTGERCPLKYCTQPGEGICLACTISCRCNAGYSSNSQGYCAATARQSGLVPVQCPAGYSLNAYGTCSAVLKPARLSPVHYAQAHPSLTLSDIIGAESYYI